MANRQFPFRAATLASLFAAALLWMVVSEPGSALMIAHEALPQQSSQQTGQQKPCPSNGKSGTSSQSKTSAGGSGTGNGTGNGSSKNSNGSGNDPCKPANKPAPLFGGSLGIKTSHQSTDSTALGFNGVDPNGQVQQAFLNATPSDTAVQKAQAMAYYSPSAADLASFERSGGLTQGPAQPHTN
jgi:hypothetical protein